jgi:thiol-disulfide isomerase/thioredoxin
MTIKRTIYLCAFVLLVTTCGVAQSTVRRAEFHFKDINGRAVSVSDYKGKVVLVNFWATWCVPCRTEIPDLVRWQRQYRRQGLRVLGVTYPPFKISEVRRSMKKLKINYRIALGSDEDKTNLTSSHVLPVTVVIDRDGTVREVIEGIIYPDEFKKKVRPLVTARSK